MQCAPCLGAFGCLCYTGPRAHFHYWLSVPQSATDIAQIQELQTQVEEVKKEKQSLQEKVLSAWLLCTELSSESLCCPHAQ